MKIYQLSPVEALASLRSAPSGLSEDEARRRQVEFGFNRVEETRGEPLWRRLGAELTHFFALVLWIGAGLAFLAEWHSPGQGMALLGWAIVAVIVLNGAFSFWQEFRAERAVAALRKLLPRRVRAMRDGVIAAIDAERLVPGDIVLLGAGDNVPADCRVLEAFGLRVNTSTLTGESRSAARSAEPCSADEALHARNLLLAGTSLVAGEARALVFATGMHTEFGKIAYLTQTAGDGPSPLQQDIERLSRWVALLALGVGVVFFAVGQAIGLPFWFNFVFAIGVIVANVPEGLLPTVTLSLAMASQRMARRNALVRHMPAVEALGAASVICTDKTGTLTRNVMTVRRLVLPEGPLDPEALDPAQPSARRLLAGALHCHSAVRLGASMRWSGDPTEVALVEFAQRYAQRAPSPRIDELPFDADRRRMSTLHEHDGARIVYCKGALETVLALCARVDGGEAAPAPLSEDTRACFLRAQESLAEAGLRVLAFAYRELGPAEAIEVAESNLVLVGLVGLEDPPRAEVTQAVATCRQAGIRVIMITGDHPHTARAIARQTGLARTRDPRVITGEELRRLSDAELQLALDAPEVLFARIGAEQKMRIVETLKRKGEIVAVTGDGVNDAPALRSAHIGIAMGLCGTDVAKEAADLVLLDDNFASIVAAIEEGRAVFENLRKFLTYILTSNIPELVPYLAFVVFRIPLPLTVVQILAVDLGTDILPALALGAEKPDPETMRRPPRRREEPLLTRAVLARAYLFLGPLEAAAAMVAFFFVLEAGGWRYGEMPAVDDPLYLRATAACFAAIVVMQVVNVFLCRHPRRSLFVRGWQTSRLIAAAIAIEALLLLAIVYSPAGQWLFGTAALDFDVWLLLLPLALAMLALEELRKWIVRSLARS
ncbi:MAG: cation-transporting P-type ATPase [Burkholderiales bacterium]|nr:cation-transporting P-type ATPase [Burkholderiales bacterium]